MSKESRFLAFLAYLLSIAGFLLVYFLKRHDRFAMYHAKQSLVLFIAYVAVWIAAKILGVIPFLGVFISAILWLMLVVLWVVGMIHALTGEEKPIPIIGEIAHKFDF